jgi:hypothetical protein
VLLWRACHHRYHHHFPDAGSHPLKLSFGFSSRLISGVHGGPLCTGMICWGGGAVTARPAWEPGLDGFGFRRRMADEQNHERSRPVRNNLVRV